MGKTAKATKRYSQNHLKDALKNRKTAQKIKFREKKKWGKSKTPEELAAEKRKKEGKGEEEAEEEEEEEEGSEDEAEEDGKKGNDAYKGNVDDFLEKGFFEAMSDGEDDDDEDEDHEKDDEDDEDDREGDDDDKEEEDEEEAMKKEMAALQKKDPAFLKYLEENDPELLKFGEEEEEADEGEEEEADEEGNDDDEGKKRGPQLLTQVMIAGWAKQLDKGDSFVALRDMVRAFESACHIDQADDQLKKLRKGAEGKTDKGEADAVRFKFRISSGQVFERLMRVCITKMHLFIAKYLSIDPNPEGDKKLNPQSSQRWKKSSNVIKAYVKSIVSFTETLTDPVMVHMLLRHAERMIPYARPFPKVARKLLKVTLRVFGLAEENRVQAFVLVRKLALEMPHPFIEACYKGLYLTYVRQVKFTNPNVAQGQLFMAQCVVELFGLDMNVAYEHAFVYIRQIAIQLRGALTANSQKSKESQQAITCWQFVNTLCLWSRMLCAYSGQDQLYALVYPFVQVTLGVLRHVNAPKYYPLRLKLSSALIRVGYHAKVYIPLSPFYLDILSKRDLYKTSNRGGDQPIEWETMIKVQKQIISSRMYQEGAFEETLKGLLIYMSSICYSPAFPEVIVQVVMQLRVFAKATSVNRFRRQAKDLIDKLEKNAAWVMRARGQKGVSPHADGDLNCLRPSGGGAGSGLAPLHAVHLQSSQQAGGGLKELLEARNSTVKGGDKVQDDDEDDDEEEEEEEEESDDEGGASKKDEPRWKQAKREKRARMRAEKKAAKRKGGEEQDEEAAPAKKKKKATPAKKRAPAERGQHGEDEVEDLQFSSDDE